MLISFRSFLYIFATPFGADFSRTFVIRWPWSRGLLLLFTQSLAIWGNFSEVYKVYLIPRLYIFSENNLSVLN